MPEITRRAVLTGSVLSLLGISAVFSRRCALARPISPIETFESALDALRADYILSWNMREAKEIATALDDGLERGLIRAPRSATRISSHAADLIIACEVTDQENYTRRCRHPVWPRGRSGVTIGIGYDLGYVTPSDAQDDWRNVLPAVSPA